MWLKHVAYCKVKDKLDKKLYYYKDGESTCIRRVIMVQQDVEV
jgi:hypothetical protein